MCSEIKYNRTTLCSRVGNDTTSYTSPRGIDPPSNFHSTSLSKAVSSMIHLMHEKICQSQGRLAELF